MAYDAQGKSLIDVQIRGKGLEKSLRDMLGGKSCRIPYGSHESAKIQADIVLSEDEESNTIISVTHTKPDTVGHSNENKFQLKIGELALWKMHDPNLKVILVVGGKKREWLPYVLESFPHFFDESIYVWNEDDMRKLKRHGDIRTRNDAFWLEEKKIQARVDLSQDDPPDSYMRERFWKEIIPMYLRVDNPSSIKNEVFRRCMQTAYDRFIDTKANAGSEWKCLTSGTKADYDRFWELRSFFNPSEAAVMITLERMGIPFLGSIANDVTLPSMLHDLGMSMKKTKVSEDFVVYSRRHKMPVLIQCKSSGGGKDRHGKNIQNRAKEQVGRGILYRCQIKKDAGQPQSNLVSKGKWYQWVAVLDGDWGVTKSYPLKYVHMLQIAGYDKILPADSLIDENCDLKFPNPLSDYLQTIDCNVSQQGFNDAMALYRIGEETSYQLQGKNFSRDVD